MTPARPRAIFLDRDGVINRDIGYVGRVQDFEFLPGVIPALQGLQRRGYLLALVTNQSGLARGYFTAADHARVTAHMVAELTRHGVALAGIEHCPHLPDARVPEYRCACACRKPQPGMLLALAARLGIAMAQSILVGDKVSDIQAGRAAGVGRCYLVRSGQVWAEAEAAAADAVYADLAECVQGLTT